MLETLLSSSVKIIQFQKFLCCLQSSKLEDQVCSGTGGSRGTSLSSVELPPQNIVDYISTPRAAAGSSYSCVQHTFFLGEQLGWERDY